MNVSYECGVFGRGLWKRFMRDARPPCWRIPIAGIILLMLLVGAAAPPTTAPSTQPILTPQDLATLQQLETGNWRQRQSIQQQLFRRGVGDMPIVAAMLDHTRNPEARARLTAALKEMEQARRMGASLVTLHFKNAPAKTVYASLFDQAWAPRKSNPADLLDSLAPVSIEADHEPFWAVMQRLESATDLGMDRPAGEYVLRHGATVVGVPQKLSGGFLVVLRSVRPFVMGNPGGKLDKYFWLDLSVYPEPKLNVQMLNPLVKIDQATDDHGNALDQRPEMTSLQNNVPPGAYQVSLCMMGPEKNPGSHLVHFRATLNASVALEWSRFDIDNLPAAKPQSIDVNGLPLRFTGCQKANGQNGYQVSFETPQDPQNRFQQVMLSAPSMRVLDANGRELQCFSSTTSQNPAVGNTMAYTFGGQMGQGVPKRLVWDIPTVVHVLDIPVDFKGLNLDFANGVDPAH
jgi:hypothetical protein